jgi:hypothetical protein
MLSVSGGTGKHNGYKISFTKEDRIINQDIERKKHLPGPCDY